MGEIDGRVAWLLTAGALTPPRKGGERGGVKGTAVGNVFPFSTGNLRRMV